MRLATTQHAGQPISRRCRRGLTLLEVSVALVLIVLATALVAPSFTPPVAAARSLDDVASAARLMAVRRGQILILHIDSTGAWQLVADDGTRLQSGARVAPAHNLQLAVTPLGACRLLTAPASVSATWDAARCRTISP